MARLQKQKGIELVQKTLNLSAPTGGPITPKEKTLREVKITGIKVPESIGRSINIANFGSGSTKYQQEDIFKIVSENQKLLPGLHRTMKEVQSSIEKGEIPTLNTVTGDEAEILRKIINKRGIKPYQETQKTLRQQFIKATE